ncbi:response regulator [Gramella sp. BOM4]|nr:response regulator [Christiangramia bathymodioli]
MNKLREIRVDEVLVIEDDPIFSTLNAHLIKTSLGATCRIFEDASAAMNYLDDAKPNDGKKLILLDLNLPGMSGWDFLDAVAKKSYRDELVVIIITSSLFKEDKSRSKNYSQVIAYFTKPVKRNEFNDFLSNQSIIANKIDGKEL